MPSVAASDLNCRLFYDLEPRYTPVIGDYLVTVGKRCFGSAYLILGVRLRAAPPRSCDGEEKKNGTEERSGIRFRRGSKKERMFGTLRIQPKANYLPLVVN
jgi:hypothetical protein